jgi:hypothetical protein
MAAELLAARRERPDAVARAQAQAPDQQAHAPADPVGQLARSGGNSGILLKSHEALSRGVSRAIVFSALASCS